MGGEMEGESKRDEGRSTGQGYIQQAGSFVHISVNPRRSTHILYIRQLLRGGQEKLGVEWSEATQELGGWEASKTERTQRFFSSHIHWMEQFPDDSPLARLRLPIVILGVFLSLDVIVGTGATVSGTVTHDAPGSSSATTAAPASTKDEDVVAADGSTRPARLAEDVLLLVFPVAATTACRLHRLFD
jgi:hypothetical protein